MPNTYTKIAKITANGSTASYTFSNIPQTYTDLKVHVSSRDSVSGGGAPINCTFNGDTTAASYSFTVLRALSNSANTFRGSNTGVFLNYGTGATNTSGAWGNTDFYIPNYRGTSFKQILTDAAPESNQTAFDSATIFLAQLYKTTGPITSMNFTAQGNFVVNSTFTLYGITSTP
jgi:hypothetical protein